MKVNLNDAIKASYGNREAIRNVESKGYKLDRGLSNGNEKTFVNNKKKKILYTIAGTHNFSDVGTDIYLGLGKLQNTNRYKEAEKTLNQAKDKYKNYKVKIAAHSLGGSIGQTLSSKANKTVTLDSGYTIGQKTRGESYRTQGDLVSLFGANSKKQNTIKNGNFLSRNKGLITGSLLGPVGAIAGALYDAKNNHDVNLIKNKNIFI